MGEMAALSPSCPHMIFHFRHAPLRHPPHFSIAASALRLQLSIPLTRFSVSSNSSSKHSLFKFANPNPRSLPPSDSYLESDHSGIKTRDYDIQFEKDGNEVQSPSPAAAVAVKVKNGRPESESNFGEEIPLASSFIETLEANDPLKYENGDDADGENEVQFDDVRVSENEDVNLGKLKAPHLTVKEKKELVSYANSLGKKLKIQQVGKWGVTASVASSFLENLEANELLKLKIQKNCPGELADAVKQLEAATGSVVIGQIGRTVIIYKPSATKQKALEKQREARKKPSIKKTFRLKPRLQEKTMKPRKVSNRGRRGSSRFL